MMQSFVQRATCARDRLAPAAWRVEAEHEDGAVSVAVFSGPFAREHATAFAAQTYGPDAVDWTGRETGNG